MRDTTTCFSPFIYFVDADPDDTQVWHGGSEHDDGRLEGTEAISVFGFYSKAAGHDSIAEFINARLADPFSVADQASVTPRARRAILALPAFGLPRRDEQPLDS